MTRRRNMAVNRPSEDSRSVAPGRPRTTRQLSAGLTTTRFTEGFTRIDRQVHGRPLREGPYCDRQGRPQAALAGGWTGEYRDPAGVCLRGAEPEPRGSHDPARFGALRGRTRRLSRSALGWRLRHDQGTHRPAAARPWQPRSLRRDPRDQLLGLRRPGLPEQQRDGVHRDAQRPLSIASSSALGGAGDWIVQKQADYGPPTVALALGGEATTDRGRANLDAGM